MYEKMQIDSLLQDQHPKIERGLGLFLVSRADSARRIFSSAIAPALKANDIDMYPVSIAFDSDSKLSEATHWLRQAEIVIADLSEPIGDLLYVLGLAHGLGRCPLLTVRSGFELPFNLAALRHVEYRDDQLESLRDFRDHLTRAIRVFLAASRSEK